EGMDSFDAFNDVNEDNWFYYYVAWAYTEGLVQGDGRGRFLPRDYITREQLAAMLARTIEHEIEIGEIPFPDRADISTWATDYVYIVFHAELMIGDTRGNFRPRTNIMRAEVATAVNRMLGRVDSREAFVGLGAAIENLENARDFPDIREAAWYFPSVLGAANDHYLTRDDDGVIDWKYIRIQQ
ncbi:MAG: S-layer homology domain-containing protein, partial [Oscillospiraceae bacterium]|nr:S-layer homology domain-containing protein [Oscillospiraceae bacterium]